VGETNQVLQQYALEHGNYSLCVSTIEPRKKIDALLDAYSCLPHDLRRRYPLVLIGSVGWKCEALHQRIERCCAEGWVNYFGYVPEADLPVLYAGARLFVYPSNYEGFGLPVLEAMASGVPVVTSDCSSLPEVAGGAALLVDPDEVDSLADCVQRGLTDEEWRLSASSHGLNVASRFTWDRCVEETVQVYRLLM
jgi:alpha-1,3-rhamnosyl/mannosyltransferase